MPQHDPAARRKAQRKGREKGAWIFVTAEELRAMGFDTDADPPHYRTWTRRKTLLVQLYAEA